MLHFYTMVGAIPLGLLTVCVNVFVGPARLAPIPDGYDPKPEEYYRVSGITKLRKKSPKIVLLYVLIAHLLSSKLVS